MAAWSGSCSGVRPPHGFCYLAADAHYACGGVGWGGGGLSALTHNPLLLRYTESTERAINPLHAPKSAGSYLHKDIKETEGELHRNMLLVRAFTSPLLLHLFLLRFLDPLDS